MAALQKEVDGEVEDLLDDDQKNQMKQMRAMIARGGPARRSGPAAAGRPPPGPGGPPGPPGGFGGNAVFRAYRYGPDYPGLAGKDLKPGKTVEELQPKEPETAKTHREEELMGFDCCKSSRRPGLACPRPRGHGLLRGRCRNPMPTRTWACHAIGSLAE